MFKYIIRRLIGLIPVLFCVSIVVFIITRVIPGNPAQVMLGPQAPVEAVRALEAKLGLDQPYLVQYWGFLKDLARGDLGFSIYYHDKVLTLILERLPRTLVLGTTSLIIALVVAVPMGIMSATKQNSIFDYLGMTVSLVGVSIPVFWLGMMMAHVFAVRLGWLPSTGMGSLQNGLWHYLRHLILPSIALSTIPMATFARITRSSMLEVIRQDYIRTARAKGLSERVVIWKHGLKNALIPLVTVLGMQISSMLSGAVLTETIFAWPGMGRLIVDAIDKRDYMMVQGGVIFIAFMFVLVNLVVDVVYVLINPKISYDQGKGGS